MWTDAARERCKDDGRRYPSDLTDAEWQTIEPVLRSCATLTVDLRDMVDACLYLERRIAPGASCRRSLAPSRLCGPGANLRFRLARPLPGRRP